MLAEQPLQQRLQMLLPTSTNNDNLASYVHFTGVTCAYPDLNIHDTKHLFFAEPSCIRNLLDFSPQVCIYIYYIYS